MGKLLRDHNIPLITLTYPTKGKLRKTGRKVHITKMGEFPFPPRHIIENRHTRGLDLLYSQSTQRTHQTSPNNQGHATNSPPPPGTLGAETQTSQDLEKNKRMKRVQEIITEAEDYVQQLVTQNWLSTCDYFNENLHTARVLQIPRSLVGQAKTKTEPQTNAIVHQQIGWGNC